jgi:hypothetical protein
MLMRRTAQRFGGGTPSGIDPYQRFYLPSTGLAAVNPAYDASWSYTLDPTDRKRCVQARTNSPTTSAVVVDPIGGAGRHNLYQQWVSDPVAPQTISGTIAGYARVASDTPNTYRSITSSLRVVSLDGTVVRGTLLALAAGGGSNPFAASLTNRTIWSGNPVQPVSTQIGDRLVIELGCFSSADPIDVVSQLSMGDNSATDLPADETTTAANNPWIQLSRS